MVMLATRDSELDVLLNTHRTGQCPRLATPKIIARTIGRSKGLLLQTEARSHVRFLDFPPNMDDLRIRLGDKYRVVFSRLGKCVDVFQIRQEVVLATVADDAPSDDSNDSDSEQLPTQQLQQQRRVWREALVFSARDILRYWAVAPRCVLVQLNPHQRYLFVSGATLYEFSARDGDAIDAFVCDANDHDHHHKHENPCPYAIGREWVYALDYHCARDSTVIARRHTRMGAGNLVLCDEPVPMYALA